MRALDAVRSTELEVGAVKLSTMILDILVICPTGLYWDLPMYAAPQSKRTLATCLVAGRNLPLALCNSCTSWFVHLSYGRIYKLSHHPMSSHVIPCHPTSSHVSFKIELVQCDSRWTFFRPKLHLRNFNLEHFQAESHFEACDKHFGFAVNFWT